MAEKKNRSRIIIWSIVGVLVVVAVVFLVLGRRGVTGGERNISDEDVPGFVARMQSRMGKFEQRVAAARSELGESEVFSQIDGLLEKVRVGLDEIQQLTDAAAIKEKMEQIKDDYNQAKQILKEST